MRVRPLLTLAFLAATLLPSLVFGWWSYQHGVKQEFAEVKDRHLLLARNLGTALERYHVDLASTVESAARALSNGATASDFSKLLSRLNIECIALLDAQSHVTLKTMAVSSGCGSLPPSEELETLLAESQSNSVTYSPVMGGPAENNVIYAAINYRDAIAVARINTAYFVELGKAITFGVKGHAAIVDHEGNVLAHPLAGWIAERRNIAKVSAVSRMMRGETGIEQFYSPALKGDMIAGLTSVEGPGWGVMIPQPVDELYEKVLQNNKSILGAIAIGLIISLILVAVLFAKLVAPIERIIAIIRRKPENGELQHIELSSGPVTELKNFVSAYNNMVDEVTASNARIVELAHTDLVTGLPNRNSFHVAIEQKLDKSLDDGPSGALIFLDIDHFKEINDLHGHQKGDEILRAYATRLTACSRDFAGGQSGETPAVFRVGGDEFAIILPCVVDAEFVQNYLEAVLHAVDGIGPQLGVSTRCGASLGCSFYPQHGASVNELMRHADIAMYQAKTTGKNAAQIYDPAVGSLTETEIRAEFAKAISGNQLVLEYQPTVCTRRKAVAGAEALVRWHHPRLGRLPPNVWLPAIAGTSMMGEMGDWVFDTALRDQRAWKRKGYDLTVAVNFSSDQFANADFAAKLIETAQKSGSDPTSICLEITEDALFSNVGRAEQTLAQLKETGFKIAIDDFGRGYSNLARLAQLPIDLIKIDHTLIAGAQKNARVSMILDTTATMAKSLGCKIVAEGIETRELAEFATMKHANLLQGFFFAASMPPSELIEWVDAAEEDSLATYRASMQAA